MATLISLFCVVVAQDSEGSVHPIGRVNLEEEDMTSREITKHRSLEAF